MIQNPKLHKVHMWVLRAKRQGDRGQAIGYESKRHGRGTFEERGVNTTGGGKRRITRKKATAATMNQYSHI